MVSLAESRPIDPEDASTEAVRTRTMVNLRRWAPARNAAQVRRAAPAGACRAFRHSDQTAKGVKNTVRPTGTQNYLGFVREGAWFRQILTAWMGACYRGRHGDRATIPLYMAADSTRDTLSLPVGWSQAHKPIAGPPRASKKTEIPSTTRICSSSVISQ
jgi:hypothetical protein